MFPVSISYRSAYYHHSNMSRAKSGVAEGRDLKRFSHSNLASADAALAELITKDRNVMAYQAAEVYDWRDETDKAFEWLQISLDNHDTGLLSLLIDPLMRSLRHDSRYREMLSKVGLPPSEGAAVNMSSVTPQNLSHFQ
jgi:hypothetical protein